VRLLAGGRNVAKEKAGFGGEFLELARAGARLDRAVGKCARPVAELARQLARTGEERGHQQGLRIEDRGWKGADSALVE
jgi:hypothetical protein